MPRFEVTMKHQGGEKVGGRVQANGAIRIEKVEAPDRLQAGTEAQKKAKINGIYGYYVAEIKEVVCS